jgi:hypothetical protein
MKTAKFFILGITLLLFSSANAFNAAKASDKDAKHHPAFLVKKSLSLVSRNYPTEPTTLNAFYKEEVSRNNSYLSINEAILAVHKESYLKSKRDVVSVKDIRAFNNMESEDSICVKLQGGPLCALDLDIAKNPFLGCETYDIDKYYTFSYNKPETINNKEYYVIDFKPLYKKDQILFRGKLFIEKNSLAIGRIVYSMDVQRDAWSYKRFVKKSPKGKEMKINSAEYVVNYKERDGKWFFDYSSSDIQLNITDPSTRVYDIYNLKSQIAVINLVSDNNPSEDQMIIDKSDVMADLAGKYNSDSEWDKYNMIMAMASDLK